MRTVVTGTNVSQAIITQSLILKMLRNFNKCQNPVWNLMMKNIYQIQGATK
jgi:hypothetical protein